MTHSETRNPELCGPVSGEIATSHNSAVSGPMSPGKIAKIPGKLPLSRRYTPDMDLEPKKGRESSCPFSP